jgi:hemerythrin superfamily protein
VPDVVDLIERDHREVEQLFSDFQSSHDAGVATKICDELTKHTSAEEDAVYPVVAERLEDGARQVREAEAEHKEARQLIGRICNTTDEAHLADLVTELKQAVEHHVSEEESEMLPAARRTFAAEELEHLGQAFETAKDAARRQSG